MDAFPSSSLWEWLTPIEGDDRFALAVTTIVIGLAALVLIVAIIAIAVAKIHRARVEMALKRELLDRGLSPDEIATVIAAGGNGRRPGVLSPLRG